MFHMNLNVNYWFEIMWVNSHHRRLFYRKFYFMNPYDDTFRNIYFKERVAVPPKIFLH